MVAKAYDAKTLKSFCPAEFDNAPEFKYSLNQKILTTKE